MKLELNILKTFGRKAICITLILFTGIGFSFGGALANSCRGGADCLICAEATHRHAPGMPADSENPGCRSAGRNSTCGFEANPDSDKFHGIASSVRSYNRVYTGFFTAASDEYGQTLLSRGPISPFWVSDSGGAAPIYLLNHSLLR